MDKSTFLTLIATVLGFVVAYHIAHLQGSFRSPALRLRIGAANPPTPWILRVLRKSVLAIILGIPDRRARRYGVPLLFFVENRGRSPARNVWIQVSIPRNRAISTYDPSLGPEQQSTPDATIREVKDVHEDAIWIEYHVPLIRIGAGHAFMEPLVYSGEELREPRGDEPCEIPIDGIQFHIRAENANPIKKKVFVLACRARDLDQLQESTASVASTFLPRSGQWYIRSRVGSWYFLPRPSVIWLRVIMLIHAVCDVMVGEIAFHVPGKSRSELQVAGILPVVVDTSPSSPQKPTKQSDGHP